LIEDRQSRGEPTFVADPEASHRLPVRSSTNRLAETARLPNRPGVAAGGAERSRTSFDRSGSASLAE
jgi:hypothetical protein